MQTIGMSKWIAYAPFRLAQNELNSIGVNIVDNIPVNRIEGLLAGNYSAVAVSIYTLAEALSSLKNDFAVAMICAKLEFGSDWIIVRRGITNIGDLHEARIGVAEQELEIDLFEHLFDLASLPGKRDYIILPNRAAYLSAFANKQVDAVMVPQPDQATLLRTDSDATVFKVDRNFPRFGLYSNLIYNRSAWTAGLLSQVRQIFWDKAEQLMTMTDKEIIQSLPSALANIESPSEEIRSTIVWLSPEESIRYLTGRGADSFTSHLLQISEFRVRRFGDIPVSQQQVEELIKSPLS